MTQIEKYPMFLDWKKQYSENNYNIQSNLQIQYNSYENAYDIFHITRAKNPIIYIELQKTQNCQSTPEEKA